MNKFILQLIGILLTGSVTATSVQAPVTTTLPPLENSGTERLQEKEFSPLQDAEAFAARLETMDIQLHPGTEERADSSPTPFAETQCKAIVYKTLQALPKTHTQYLNHLTLFFTPDGSRGQGSSNVLILRCLNITNSELTGVAVHEMGHITDLGFLQSTQFAQETEFLDFEDPVYADDPSATFYRITWLSSTERTPDSSPLDFVTGYAMEDPFEDFAESYAFYVLQGPSFRYLARTNTRLQQKYDFMKNSVFNGQEFGRQEIATNGLFDLYRNYDSTILEYDLNEFWARGGAEIAGRTF